LFELEERRNLETLSGKNSKEAHQARVREFEERLQGVLSESQFSDFLDAKPKRRVNTGLNPFGGN